MTLNGSGSSDPNAYRWSWGDGTNTYNPTGPSPTITLPSWGVYDVALEVTYPTGIVSTDSVRITAGDTIAPRTTAAVVGTMNADGVYTSKVDVTLTATDACTGVKEIHYTINGAETVYRVDPVAKVASTTFSLVNSGTYVITFWAVDNAGRASSPVQIAPVPVNNGGGGGGGGGTCVGVTLYSDGSGQLLYALDGNTYQPVTGPVTVCGTIDMLAYGYTTPSANVELVQTLLITVDITVSGTVQGLIDLVHQYVTDQNVANELSAILASASNATTPSDQDAYLQEFKKKVQAQSGKKITAEVAGILTRAADFIINNN